jgi:FlaA1/EpsC-like NDP-sugar epimerase
MALVLLAWWAAFWLRFNLDIPPEFEALAVQTTGWVRAVLCAGPADLARVYRHVWSYIGLPELRQLGAGVLLGGLITVAAVLLMLRFSQLPPLCAGASSSPCAGVSGGGPRRVAHLFRKRTTPSDG